MDAIATDLPAEKSSVNPHLQPTRHFDIFVFPHNHI